MFVVHFSALCTKTTILFFFSFHSHPRGRRKSFADKSVFMPANSFLHLKEELWEVHLTCVPRGSHWDPVFEISSVLQFWSCDQTFLRLLLSYFLLSILCTLSSFCGDLGSEISWSTKSRLITDANQSYISSESSGLNVKQTYIYIQLLLMACVWDWIDSPAAKNPSHSQGKALIPSTHRQIKTVTLVMGDLIPFLGLYWYLVFNWYTHIQNVYT